MKKILTLSIAAFLLFSVSAQAQLFKKLTKKIQDRVENVVVENISDKAASETDKKLDKLWETQLKNASFPLGMETVNFEEIPDSYDFTWEYTMTMQTAEGEMEMTYLLKEDAKYMGMKVPQAENMLTVMDQENNMTVMYLSSDENKFVTATKFDLSEQQEDQGENIYEDMEVKELGTKTINGYLCQGYEMNNEDTTFTFYVTDETEISFNDMFQTNQKNIPKGFDAEWLKDGKGMMMYMEVLSQNDPSSKVTMTCTGIKEKSFSINKNEYAGF